jgi:hypothetical protein
LFQILSLIRLTHTTEHAACSGPGQAISDIILESINFFCLERLIVVQACTEGFHARIVTVALAFELACECLGIFLRRGLPRRQFALLAPWHARITQPFIRLLGSKRYRNGKLHVSPKPVEQ